MKHLGTIENETLDAKTYDITDKMIDDAAILSGLELSEEEKERAKTDMREMLAYMDKLQELDTEGVEPLVHLFPVTNVFREDAVTNQDGSRETLQNAPMHRDGGFLVPETI